jgi:hypothetical protein
MKTGLILVLLTIGAVAKDNNPVVTIQIVDAQTSVRQWLYRVPGYDSTRCGTNGCTTIYDYPSTGSVNVGQVHVILWCQAEWRHCYTLEPGSYQAELEENVVWIISYDLDGKKGHRTKYHWTDRW